MMRLYDKLSRYSRTEITIVALHDRKENKYYNIYSVVELCTADQIKSNVIGKAPYYCERDKINDDYTLYIRRVFFDNVKSGYDFFTKQGKRPVFADNQSDDVLYDYDEMTTEPDGEEGILFHHGSSPKNKLEEFLPAFEGSYRIYTQLSKSSKLLNLLPDKDMLKTGYYIHQYLGIDVLKRQELWGSAFLCLPNPYIKRVNLRLGREGRKLIVRIVPRDGQDKFVGRMELIDERDLGIGFVVCHEITEDRFLIDMPNEPERLRYRIFSEEGELIAEDAHYFVKQINCQMAMVASKRIFSFPDSNRDVTVDMKTYIDLSVGDVDESAYAQRLRDEEKKRSLELLTKTHVFNYFPGIRQDNNSRKNAIKAIKEIIGSAKKHCILCDPYFSRDDFLTYGIVISSLDITLHIVTSENFIGQPVKKESKVIQADGLADVLRQCEKIKVECHVLQGNERSPLHDRFMVIDNDVYILGSSFSEFGARATTLYQVPNPEILREEALKWSRNEGYSISLSKWLALRNDS